MQIFHDGLWGLFTSVVSQCNYENDVSVLIIPEGRDVDFSLMTWTPSQTRLTNLMTQLDKIKKTLAAGLRLEHH